MHSSKQQVVNRYLEYMDDELDHNFNKVDDVVWVNADKIMAVLQEHALLKEMSETKLPPMIEADWDTNDVKEFDRLLYQALFEKPTLH